MGKMDELRERIIQSEKRDPRLILAGVVAVCKDLTLVGDDQSFTDAIGYFKDFGIKVPTFFKEAFDCIKVRQRHNYLTSDEIDMLFLFLDGGYPAILWRDRLGNKGGMTLKVGNEYLMPEDHVKRFIEENNLGEEEINFSWKIAQKMHVLPDEPVVMRNLQRYLKPAK